MTHTYALLELSQSAYDEIAGKMRDAGYGHAFDKEEGAIDMHGIGVSRAAEPKEHESGYYMRPMPRLDEGRRAQMHYDDPPAGVIGAGLSLVGPIQYKPPTYIGPRVLAFPPDSMLSEPARRKLEAAGFIVITVFDPSKIRLVSGDAMVVDAARDLADWLDHRVSVPTPTPDIQLADDDVPFDWAALQRLRKESP